MPQLSVIALRYGPPCGVTVTVYFAVWPADTVALDGDTAMAKSVTVICRSVDVENPTPLLVAETVTADGPPTGHVNVDPADVPQSPCQFKAVSAH